MLYILLGDNLSVRDTKLNQLKNKILPDPQSHPFDLEILSAHKLSSELFKKALVALPALSSRRLVIVREAHRLSEQNKQILQAIAAEQYKHHDIILESDEWTLKDSMVSRLSSLAEISSSGHEKELSVFDMTRMIELNKKTDALKILFELIENGQHPLQILGGLVWFWGKSKGKISFERYEKGLKDIQEADLNIKRSRLDSVYAIEVLVVKLSGGWGR